MNTDVDNEQTNAHLLLNRLKEHCKMGNMDEALAASSRLDDYEQLMEGITVCCVNGNTHLIDALFKKHRLLHRYLGFEQMKTVIERGHIRTFTLLVEWAGNRRDLMVRSAILCITSGDVQFIKVLCESQDAIVEMKLLSLHLFKTALLNGRTQIAIYLYTKFPLLSFFVLDEENKGFLHTVIKNALREEDGNKMIDWLVSVNHSLSQYVPNGMFPEGTKEISENSGCIICYEPAGLITECGHLYCADCLRSTRHHSLECAYCRQTYTRIFSIVVTK